MPQYVALPTCRSVRSVASILALSALALTGCAGNLDGPVIDEPSDGGDSYEDASLPSDSAVVRTEESVGAADGGAQDAAASVRNDGSSDGVSTDASAAKDARAASVGDSGASAENYACRPGLPSAVKDLASLTSDDTTTDETPLGTRYRKVKDHVASDAELAFLKDPHKQPRIPNGTSGLSLKTLPVTLYPSSGGIPIPADVNQHAIGNCNGDTAFASLAYANPTFIKRLITDNRDGTYTVAMYDPRGARIQVSLDSAFLVDKGGKIAAVSGKKGVADWATVLEKATMKYIEVWPVVADMNGIGSEHQLPMFTRGGGSFAFNRGSLSVANLTRVVKAALEQGKLISGGFGSETLTLASGMKTVTAHGYAVLVPNDKSMVAMRNPWGVNPTDRGNDASTDGVLDILPDAKWAKSIDLRVIDPGEACGPGVTDPYLPLLADKVEALDMLQLERATGGSVP